MTQEIKLPVIALQIYAKLSSVLENHKIGNFIWIQTPLLEDLRNI